MSMDLIRPPFLAFSFVGFPHNSLTLGSSAFLHITAQLSIQVGCSYLNYTRGTTCEDNLNSTLSSLTQLASSYSLSNLTGTFSSQDDIVYGHYGCSCDLNQKTQDSCGKCVTAAVSRLRSCCSGALSGFLEHDRDGCSVEYNNNDEEDCDLDYPKSGDGCHTYKEKASGYYMMDNAF